MGTKTGRISTRGRENALRDERRGESPNKAVGPMIREKDIIVDKVHVTVDSITHRPVGVEVYGRRIQYEEGQVGAPPVGGEPVWVMLHLEGNAVVRYFETEFIPEED